MHKQFRRRRLPYGFSFLNVESTKVLQEKARASQTLIEKAGYERIMPAAVDYPETFEVFGGYDSFKMRDHLGDDLSLRNDITVQVIKGYINQFEEAEVESRKRKLYYMAPVFRDIQKSYPSLREVFQIGAENIGCESEKAVTELVILADEILSQTFEHNYEMLLSDASVFTALEKFVENKEFGEWVKHKDAVALSDFFQTKGLSEEFSLSLSMHLFYPMNLDRWFERFDEIVQKCEQNEFQDFLQNLRQEMESSYNLSESLRNKKIPIQWEPVLFPKVRYYTGYFFEGYVEKQSFPVLRGGSYDELVNEYSNISIPASGFALDISPII
ncbi:MAG: ATP phosphoribosyltransferase regulatory subunit [Spirochaetia bacterium]|nr:ATP phosphoribosyltransferase regulatory subunit [Spirochaetia bacterium]